MQRNTLLALTGGCLTGFANGLFGGGGGMIAVPYLERIALYPTPRAHATAIAVVLPATLVSGFIYLLFSLVPLTLFVPVSVGVCMGGFAGAKLLNILNPKIVSVVFSFLMLAAGVRMLFL